MREKDELFTLEIPRKLGVSLSALLSYWSEKGPVDEVTKTEGLSDLIAGIIKKSRIEGVKPPPLGLTISNRFQPFEAFLMERLNAERVMIAGNGTYGGDSYQVIATIQKKNIVVADFRMSPMDGCAAICTFHHSNVNEKLRGMGIGTLLHSVRIHAAKDSGFALAQCTTLTNNEAQNRILKRFGWQINHEFNNPKTENDILMWTRNLTIDIPEFKVAVSTDGEHEEDEPEQVTENIERDLATVAES